MIKDAWFKLVAVLLLCAAITFVNDVELFKSPWMLTLVGIVTVALGVNNVTEDLGILALMVCLFVLVYDLQVMETTPSRTSYLSQSS